MNLSEVVSEVVRTANNAVSRAEALVIINQAHTELLCDHAVKLIAGKRRSLDEGGSYRFLLDGSSHVHSVVSASYVNSVGTTISLPSVQAGQAAFYGDSVEVQVNGVPKGVQVRLLVNLYDEATGTAVGTAILQPTPIAAGFACMRITRIYDSMGEDAPYSCTQAINRDSYAWVDTPNGIASGIYLDTANWPAELLSESASLQIPEAHRMTALKSLAMMRIEARELGNSTYWADQYKKDLEQFTSSMSRNIVADKGIKLAGYYA